MSTHKSIILEISEEEYDYVVENGDLVSDGSYANRIADILVEAVQRRERL